MEYHSCNHKDKVERKVKKCNSINTQLIIKSPGSIEDSLSTPTVTSSKYQSHDGEIRLSLKFTVIGVQNHLEYVTGLQRVD